MLLNTHSLRPTLLNQLSQLAGLADEWRDLWRRDPRATPFHSPEWLLPWAESYLSGELHALTLRGADGRLGGLVPFYRHQDPLTGQRKLLLLGCGNSDRCGSLVEPGQEAVLLDEVMGLLHELAGEYDHCDLQPLAADEPLLGLAGRMSGGQVSQVETSPVLQWSGLDWEAALPARMLKDLRYSEKRAGEDEVTISTVELGEFEDCFEQLVTLHGSRWHSRGLPGVLSEPGARRFLLGAARGLQQAGLLDFYMLRVAGGPAAAYFGFIHRQTAWYYLGGIDPAYERISPGTLLLAHAIGRAAARGAERFDFLRGGEPYKYLWGACDQPLFQCSLPGRTTASTPG